MSSERDAHAVRDPHAGAASAFPAADEDAARSEVLELMESLPDGILIKTNEERIVFANVAMGRIFGMPPEDVCRMHPADLLHPDERNRASERTRQILHEGTAPTTIYLAARPDGAPIPVEVHSQRIHFRGQTAALSVVRDVSERERAVRLIQHLERNYRDLYQNAPVMYLSASLDGTIFECNGAVSRELGWARKELIGRPLEVLLPEDDVAIHRADLDKLLRRGAFHQERELLRKDGRRVPVLVSAVIQRDEDGRPVRALVTFEDISRQRRERQKLQADHDELEVLVAQRTAELEASNAALREENAERRRTEQELRDSQERLERARRMETVGTLAGGVAHDFNNLLTVMLGHSDLALAHGDLPDGVRDAISEVRRATLRAAELTRRLLAFGQRQPTQRRLIDLNEEIREAMKMLRRVLDENIDLQVELADDLPPVFGDSTQMEQVLLNAVTNARDALPNGGTVRIRTSVLAPGDDTPRSGALGQAKEIVRLLIADDGQGIDTKLIPHVFDPFLTTKGPHRGTGLGLSVVYGIVAKHDGHVEIRSESGAGTELDILLPGLERSAMSAEGDAPPAVAAGRGEVILVLDDDAGVRAATAVILERLGYEPATAGTADEALEVLRRDRDRVSAAILDVVMPQKSGPDVADDLHAVAPDLPVLFVTGYDAGSRLEDLRAKGVDPDVLQKPFTADALGRTMRDLLTR